MDEWKEESEERTPVHGHEVQEPPERDRVQLLMVAHLLNGSSHVEPFWVQLRLEADQKNL